MIARTTSTGFGLHLVLSNAEARALLALVASGRATDHVEGELRPALLRQVGEMLYHDAQAYRRLPQASENRQDAEASIGIIKLMLEAQANPATKQRAAQILRELAARLDTLLVQNTFAKRSR